MRYSIYMYVCMYVCTVYMHVFALYTTPHPFSRQTYVHTYISGILRAHSVLLYILLQFMSALPPPLVYRVYIHHGASSRSGDTGSTYNTYCGAPPVRHFSAESPFPPSPFPLSPFPQDKSNIYSTYIYTVNINAGSTELPRLFCN